MKKIKFIVLLLFIIVSFTSCSFFNKNKIVVDSNADVIQVKNEVSDVVDSVENACIGIYCTLSSKSAAIGSGVVVKKDGIKYYAITNNHVVEDALKVEVYINDSIYIRAKVESRLPAKDLACVSFEAADKYNIGVIEVKSDTIVVNPGETVIAIGCPLDLANFNTVTVGVASKEPFNLANNKNTSNILVIQHDAAINSGNSGGSLFNINGDLIGINFEKLTLIDNNVVEGIGYAIHISEVLKFLKDIKVY